MTELKKIFKDGALIGLGLVVLTKEKIEEVVKELQQDYNLTPQEGKKFVQDLLKKSEKNTKQVEAQLETFINSLLTKIPLVTKPDLAKLEAKLLKKQGAKVTKTSAAKKKVKK